MTKQTTQDESRITKRLIAYVMLFIVLFSLLFTIISVLHENNSNKRLLDQYFTFTKNKHINTLTDALWRMNKSDIKTQMQVMLAITNIVYIAVYDSQQVLTDLGKKPKDNFKTKSIPLFHLHRNQNRQVGLLKIYATLKADDKQLSDSFWFILASNGIKMFLLAVAILWVLHYKMIRNLQFLFQHITVNNTEILKEIGFEKKQNETRDKGGFDLLTNSNNDMQLALTSLKAELRDNQEVHTGIVQKLSEGLVSLDAHFNIIGINAAAERLFGYCGDELEGEHLRKLFSDKHYNEVCLTIKNHQKLSLPGAIDDNKQVFITRKKVGDEFPANLSFIEFTSFQQIAWVIVIKDLTYWQAQSNSAHLLNLIYTSINFIALYDSDLNMIYINKAGLALSELSASVTDHSTLCLYNLLPKNDQRLFNDKVKPALTRKSFWRGEHNLQTSSGRTVPVMAEYSRLDQGEGGSEVLAVLMFDLSLQKKKESELGMLRQQLNVLLQRRTHELEAVNQELDSFSYSVSHDLRAPLRAIIGFSRILKEESIENGSKQIQDWAERIDNNSQRMSCLIQGLLALARVTRRELDLKPVDISAVSNTVLQRLKSAEPKRDVLVRVEKGMSVIADNPLVEVVMSHLLENAWKYTGHEPQAEIECSSCIKGGSRYFCIRDNGVGLNMKYTDKLFGPFQRLHAKEEFPGTGIGLATVKRVLSRHGGNIFVEAEVGLGASFYFRFSASVSEKVDNVPAKA